METRYTRTTDRPTSRYITERSERSDRISERSERSDRISSYKQKPYSSALRPRHWKRKWVKVGHMQLPKWVPDKRETLPTQAKKEEVSYNENAPLTRSVTAAIGKNIERDDDKNEDIEIKEEQITSD